MAAWPGYAIRATESLTITGSIANINRRGYPWAISSPVVNVYGAFNYWTSNTVLKTGGRTFDGDTGNLFRGPGFIRLERTVFLSDFAALQAECAKFDGINTVTLSGDILGEDSTLLINRDLTLDLNGYTLDLAVTSGAGIQVAPGVTLTIVCQIDRGTLNITASDSATAINSENAGLNIRHARVNITSDAKDIKGDAVTVTDSRVTAGGQGIVAESLTVDGNSIVAFTAADVTDKNFIRGIIQIGNQITVYGRVSLDSDFTVAAGTTLTVRPDAVLVVPYGNTLTNYGTIQNYGRITRYGIIYMGHFYGNGPVDIDLEDPNPPARGNGWTFVRDGDNRFFDIQANADVRITGDGGADRGVRVPRNTSNVNITLHYATLRRGPWGRQPFTIFDDSQVTVTLEGDNQIVAGLEESIRVGARTELTIDGDGTLTATGRIGAHVRNFITINSGTVTVTGSPPAGIGSNAGIGGNNSTVTIHGGIVTATSSPFTTGVGAPAIGGTSSTVTITGGKVTATAAEHATNAWPGIGAPDGGTITITGGDITSIAGNSSTPAIGVNQTFAGANPGTVNIIGLYDRQTNTANYAPQNGFTRGVFANSRLFSFVRLIAVDDTDAPPSLAPAGIDRRSDEYATVRFVTSADGDAFFLVQNSGEAPPANYYVKNNGHPLGTAHNTAANSFNIPLTRGEKDIYIVVYGEFGLSQTIKFTARDSVEYIDTEGIVQRAHVELLTNLSNQIGTAGQTTWYAAAGDLSWSGNLLVNGNVRLILKDKSSITARISVPAAANLTIYAQSEGGDMGRIEARGPNNSVSSGIGGTGSVTIAGGDILAVGGSSNQGGGAGIGGNGGNAGGTIRITGGNIKALGGGNAAGIGGGFNTSNIGGGGGNITISGGTVTAVGGVGSTNVNGGAGIGGSAGRNGAGGNITITGGTVYATGGGRAAGIGSGGRNFDGTIGAGTIRISGYANVTARGGAGTADTDGGAAIGLGGGSTGGGSIIISGNNVTLEAFAGSIEGNNALGGGSSTVSVTGFYDFLTSHENTPENAVAGSGNFTNGNFRYVRLSKDITAPVLSGENIVRTSSAEAQVRLRLSEGGRIFYIAQNENDPAPSAADVRNNGSFTGFERNSGGTATFAVFTLTSTPKAIYFAIEDFAGNLSETAIKLSTAYMLTDAQNTTVTVGRPATFSVEAVGKTGPFTYQWQEYICIFGGGTIVFGFWHDILDETYSTYTIPETEEEMDGRRFRAVITDTNGNTLISSTATLTVNPLLFISEHPEPATVALGETATFTVTAVGEGVLAYQWQVSTDAGLTWSNVTDGTGANTASYTTPPATVEMRNNLFRCVVTSIDGTVESNEAMLTVRRFITDTIDISKLDDNDFGERWTYANGVLTIEDDADITITGSADDGRRIVVEDGAEVRITAYNLSVTSARPPLSIGYGAELDLNIEGNNIFTAATNVDSDGIQVLEGSTLIIDGTGVLAATGSWGGAGIGQASDWHRGTGTIIIDGGNVTANGGEWSVSIGSAGTGSFIVNGGTVTSSVPHGAFVAFGPNSEIAISGGTVTADGIQTWGNSNINITGGIVTTSEIRTSSNSNISISGGIVTAISIDDWGSAITSNGGTITISGGTVTAIGGNTLWSAGIGGIWDSDTLIMDGNGVVFASSISGNTNMNGVTNGLLFIGGGDGVFIGDHITPTDDFTVPHGVVLAIEKGITLTVADGVTLTNNGIIIIEAGGSLANRGTIINNGIIIHRGILVEEGEITGGGKIEYEGGVIVTFVTTAAITVIFTSDLTLAGVTPPPQGYSWANPQTPLTVADSGSNFPAIFTHVSGNYVRGHIEVIVNRASGSALNAPVAVGSPTVDSITVSATFADGNPDNQTIEFGIGTTSDAALANWSASGAKTGVFTGLDEYTRYYFFARSVESANHNTGAPSPGTAIRTTDETPPTGTITIRGKQFSSFATPSAAALFFRDYVSVTVSGNDTGGSGVSKIEYLLAPVEFASAEAANAAPGWTSGSAVTITPGALASFIFYARIIDNDGNTTVINTDGIVIFTDSTPVTASIEHVRYSGAKTAEVNLNGNTIAEIHDGARRLAENTDFTVATGSNGRAVISFAASYLDSLPVGEHTLTITYNPRGKVFAQGSINDTPAATSIILNVHNAPDPVCGENGYTCGDCDICNPHQMEVTVNVNIEFVNMQFAGLRINVEVTNAPANTTVVIGVSTSFTMRVGSYVEIPLHRDMSVEIGANGTGTTTALITFDDLTAAFYEHIETDQGMTELLEALDLDNEADIDRDTLHNNLEVTQVSDAVVVTPPREISTITFELNGGSFTGAFATTPPAFSLTTGSAVGLLPQMPTAAAPNGVSRDGYRFTGWFTDINDERTRWRHNTVVTGNVTLHARWEEIPRDTVFRVGSVSRSGRVTSGDATMLARWFVCNDEDICLLAADIDGDGKVTLDDLILLARWLVGHNVSDLIAHN